MTYWIEVEKPSGEGRRKEFRLNDRECEFIQTGDTGSDRPSRLENNIKEKRNSLPSRFRELFFDIRTLDEGDYFSPKDWEPGWRELMGIGETDDLLEYFDSSAQETSTPAKDFGEQLGLMVRRFNLYPQGVDKQEIWADFIFGFIDGLCFHGYQERQISRTDFMDQLIDDVRQRSRRHFGELDTAEQEWFEETYMEESDREKTISRIKRILETNQINYPNRISDHVYEILTHRSDSISPNKLDEQEVLDIVDKEQLVDRIRLSELIQEDINQLRNIRSGELSALDFIEKMPDETVGEESKISSRGMASDTQAPQENLNHIERLGHYLIGEKEIDNTTWDGQPIVELVDEKQSYGSREWQLTDYGRALRGIHIHHAQSVVSLHGIESVSGFFNRALTKLNSEGIL